MQSRDIHEAKRPTAAGEGPSELGGYRLVELLGRGGMGEVWRGEREGPGGIRKRAAIKRILPQYQSDREVRERFLAEARINARLEHPNIVQVLDFGDQPEPYLVLEFVEGLSAGDLLRDLALAQTKLPAAAAAFIVAEAAAGLDYAHKRCDEAGRPLEIVHRDVSPQNVLISRDGAVKIGDFGVARAADNSFRTQEGLHVGKLVYMAPEQALGGKVDARADVFALGVTFWELLTISPLIPRNDPSAALQALSRCEFAPPTRLDPRLPPVLDSLAMTALARDPAQRYQSAGAFAQALRGFIHSVAPGFDSSELKRIINKLAPPKRSSSSTIMGAAFASLDAPASHAVVPAISVAQPLPPPPAIPRVQPPAPAALPMLPLPAAKPAMEFPAVHPSQQAATPSPRAQATPARTPSARASWPAVASFDRSRPAVLLIGIGIAAVLLGVAAVAAWKVFARDESTASRSQHSSAARAGTSAISVAISNATQPGAPTPLPSALPSPLPTPSTNQQGLPTNVPQPSTSTSVATPSAGSPVQASRSTAQPSAQSPPASTSPLRNVPTTQMDTAQPSSTGSATPSNGSSMRETIEPRGNPPRRSDGASVRAATGDEDAMIRSMLRPLRSDVGRCLRISDGSNRDVTIHVVYDGPHSVVRDVSVTGVHTDQDMERCVRAVIRDEVRVVGITGIVRIEHVYSY